MPAYEYRCRECLESFEIRASITQYDAGLEPPCPICGSIDVLRTFSSAALVSAAGDVLPVANEGGASCGCGSGGCCA